MKSIGYGVTDRGKCRVNNEDSFLVADPMGLYVVCDGIGGRSAGEVASAEAIRAIQDFFETHQRDLRDAEQRPNVEALERLVQQAIRYASKSLILAAVRDEYSDMGTTLTLLLVSGGYGIIANVGDSRAYLIREDSAKQITVDHTLGEELSAGGCRGQTAKAFNHVLTRAVGIRESVKIDTFVLDLKARDRILLCSDGLSNYFEDCEEFAALLMEEEIPAMPQVLVNLANSRGGRDNITAVVVAIDPK